jgi:tetratricopeptide (TPR) repeat protein
MSKEILHPQRSDWDLLANLGFVGIMLAATLLVYANSFSVPFLFDDYAQITNPRANLELKSLSFSAFQDLLEKSGAKHRPLSVITLALNHYFGGTDPFGYHAVNLAIHFLTGLLLFFWFLVTLRLIWPKNPDESESAPSLLALNWIAFLAALIWLLHPVQTNAVTYIVQRMTSLAAFFYILSMLLYAKGRISLIDGQKGRAAAFFAGCLVSALCALTSKEIAATLPFLILFYEWFFFQNLRRISGKYIVGGGLAAVLVFGLLTWMFLGPNPLDRILSTYGFWGFTLEERVLTEFRVLAFYLGLLAFPYPGRLHLDYDYPLSHSLLQPPATLPSIFMVAALVVISLYFARKERLLVFAIVWYLGTLIIESSVIGIEIIYEHRLYLSSAMICLAAAYLAWRGFRRKRAVTAALLVIACVFGYWTHQRNETWSDPVAFWEDNVQKTPRDPRPAQNLAFSLQIQGNYRDAAHYYRESLKFSSHPAAHHKLGFCLAKMGHYMDALVALETAVDRNHRPLGTYSLLADTYLMVGDYDKALQNYQRALRRNPDNQDARGNIRVISEFLETCEGRLDCLKSLAANYPNNPVLRYKLGRMLETRNKTREAVAYYEEALSMIRPSRRLLYQESIIHLARSYARTAEAGRGLSVLTGAAQLWPENPLFFYEAAALNVQLGNTEQALGWLEKAVAGGFHDLERLRSDQRLAPLRGGDGFQNIVQEVRARSERSRRR